jgi:MFS family permease|tara:strand:- start:4469 stop:5617 length:1149 start_codon:yes stop_codon:yes gene_type:complete
MHQYNQNRLFAASCISLLLTAMTFAIRVRLETVFGPDGMGLSLEQIGYAFMPAFWGFTLAIILGGQLVDNIGMKKGMWLAFICHAIGITLTLTAYDFSSLFVATVIMGLGNGMVEAVCNPLVASMYPLEKTKMLNRFHLWWPAGIVIGSIASLILMDIMGLGWQMMVGSLFIPLVVYGYLLIGQSFPLTERVSLGINQVDAYNSLAKPLFLFIAFCMLLSATTELGTMQRIESLLKETGVNALLVLAFINGIMIIGRALAGSIAIKIKTTGILFLSSIFAFVGLQLLANSSGSYVFIAAAFFAIGVTFFWPTTLAFISENIPESGAFGMSLIGGLGMLSVSLVLPLMGRFLDNSVGAEVIQKMSVLPFVLIFLYGGLYLRKR